MTRDDIVRMAREADYRTTVGEEYAYFSLYRFAALVAAAEREACAEAAVDAVAFNGGTVQMEAHVRQAILARSQQ